jgi:hypothetical protein
MSVTCLITTRIFIISHQQKTWVIKAFQPNVPDFMTVILQSGDYAARNEVTRNGKTVLDIWGYSGIIKV